MNDRCPRCERRYPPGRLGVCPACFLEAEIPPGQISDTLELIEEIGRGGMGTVWSARHLRLERIVAVKFLHPELAAQPDFQKRFEREARALALLSHTGIVAVHDFGDDEGRSYIVMEHVAGRPLSELVPLPPEQALDVATQVCDALAYAHRQGVVHRDVKPQNILLDTAGRAKISDFGISRLLEPRRDPGVTAAGQLVGTPSYMAPEALAGAAPDPRMDVFSLGVLIYEMVTGRLPVGERSRLSGGLDEVVSRALSPDPRLRYPSASEMAQGLRSLGSSADDLPSHERLWLRAVALLQTLATAVTLWALLQSVTPKVLLPQERQPLIMRPPEALQDGRFVSRARFETWPTLSAVAAIALALAGYGLLRRHWREAELERRLPERSLRESRTLLFLGGAAVAVWASRRWLEAHRFPGAWELVPIVGGVMEIAALFFFWSAVLEGARNARSLAREPALWAGLLLALTPPTADLAAYLTSWRP